MDVQQLAKYNKKITASSMLLQFASLPIYLLASAIGLVK